MKVRDILEKMITKRVFTIEEIAEEFYEEWKGILPKSIIKKRIVGFLQKQLQTGFVKKMWTNGHNFTIFAVKDVTRIEFELYLSKCEICGKNFYPSQHNQKICESATCQREYVRRFKREKKGISPDLPHYRRWTPEEDMHLIIAFPDYKFSTRMAEKVSQVLKRHPLAIKKRLYLLKKEAKNAKHHTAEKITGNQEDIAIGK